MYMYFIFTTNPCISYCNYSHFTNEVSAAEQSKMSCPWWLQNPVTLLYQLCQMSEALSSIACFLGFLYGYFEIDPPVPPPFQDDADFFLAALQWKTSQHSHKINFWNNRIYLNLLWIIGVLFYKLMRETEYRSDPWGKQDIDQTLFLKIPDHCPHTSWLCW